MAFSCKNELFVNDVYVLMENTDYYYYNNLVRLNKSKLTKLQISHTVLSVRVYNSLEPMIKNFYLNEFKR